MEPRDTLCIDLRPAEESILAQMRPKGRYNIRVAQRHNVSIIEDTTADHPWHDISVFKRKFGGTEIHLAPTLDYVYDAAAYNHYVATEK